MKTMMTSTVIALFLAGAASAQQAYVEIDDDVELPSLAVAADDIDDADVYDASGEEVGEVEEVLGMDSQTPSALAIEFEDEVADETRAVPLSDLSMQDDRLVINLDPEAIAQLPTYDD
jgi:hypothetical protein